MEKKRHDRSKLYPPPLGNETPWLVYAHEFNKTKHKQCQTFTPISPLPPHNKSYIRSIPQLRGKAIKASSNGWLILLDLDNQLNHMLFTLFNPTTSQSIDLPPLRDDDNIHDDGIRFYTLISTPDMDDCILCLISSRAVSFCWPANSDPTWVDQRLEIDGRHLQVFKIVVLGRVIYALALIEFLLLPSMEYTILSMGMEVDAANNVSNYFTLKNLRLDWPEAIIPWWRRQSFLVESCGKIYCVIKYGRHGYPGRNNIVVTVFELDLNTRKWVEVKCLDGRAFFIVDEINCVGWCWGSNTGASNEVIGNCVYYLSKRLDVQTVHCFRLAEKSVTLLGVNSTLIKPCSSVVWLMPQHERLSEKGWKELLMMKKAKTLNQGINTITEELSQHNRRQKNRLCWLPLNLIESIVQRLQIFDYFELRGTCKLFRSLECDHNTLPSFIYIKDDDHGSYQVIDPFQGHSRSIILQPSRDPYTIEFFKDGWLLIVVNHPTHSRLQFFNPFTRVQGYYCPTFWNLELIQNIGFSTNPTSNDCVTVGFVDTTMTLEIHYHRYGDEEWSRHIVRYGNRYVHVRFEPGTSPVYHKGAFYILDKSGYLGEFKLVDQNVSWKVYIQPQKYQQRYHIKDLSCHLVECNGQLYSVFFAKSGKWVDVFRFNDSKKWSPVKRIGNYCFFTGHLFSTSFGVSKERNRIYLPRFKGNGMVFYCLETGKYGVSGSEDSLQDFYNTTEPWHSCWI